MYLDDLPELSHAARIRSAARGVAVREGGRAVAVAFVADGTLVPPDTLVRFELTRGEDPGRRLADAFAATGARAIRYFGGDEAARTAVRALDLQVQPVGAAFVHRMDPLATVGVALRPPSERDRAALDELIAEHVPSFAAPQAEIAEIARDPAGVVFRTELEAGWTELRAVVYPGVRGRGFGAAILAAAADRLEATGRHVCAATASVGGRERRTLEAAGFRLADYYFLAAKR